MSLDLINNYSFTDRMIVEEYINSGQSFLNNKKDTFSIANVGDMKLANYMAVIAWFHEQPGEDADRVAHELGEFLAFPKEGKIPLEIFFHRRKFKTSTGILQDTACAKTYKH